VLQSKYVCSHQLPGRDLNGLPGCLYLKRVVAYEVGHNLGLKDDYTNPKLLMYGKKKGNKWDTPDTVGDSKHLCAIEVLKIRI